MFKRRHKGNSTAWPLILVNYNLHASIRNRLENIICVGVIPGPKECKDINSFLAPLIEELEALEAGVEASKVASEVDDIQGEGANFILHAFLIILFGDIPAVSKLLMLEGHRGKAPCRACLILGTEHRGEAGSVTYYVPLTTPDNLEVLLPEELSMRTHDTYLFYYNQLETIQGVGARAQLATDCGLNGRPLFTRLKSIDLSCCAPYELMHLFFENLVPNMISHWKGIFKDVEDDAAYRVSADDWKIIGEQTAQATRTIPGQFVGTIPNIDIDMGLFKAEAFAFWFMYLAPILLSGRLARAYYEHFLAMREIFIWTLDMGITPEQVYTLETMIHDWVKEYERLYYRYEYDRLPTCPVTIHALLHIPHFIRQLGPLTLFWCFLMERFCGYLLRPALLNRVRPYEYLDNFIRRRAQLQIVARVHDIPALIKPITHRTLVCDEYISQKEIIYPGFQEVVFGQPVCRNYPANDALQRQIARYFGFPEGQDLTIEQHRARVDWRTLVRHGRFRLASMGDRIRVADRIKNDSVARDNSFIRYELLPDRNANFRQREDRPMRLINYGQVIDAIYVEYVRDHARNERVPYLLARVRECSDTHGLDATDPRTPIVTYNRLDAPKVINLKTVHSAVGRIKIGGRHTWAIIDRSRGARTQFNDENGQPDPNLN
ncbi:Transposase family Tnp2 protein [Ceratobasidium sp. AG-Ba]|nr:Transposase family Tnp2 protein [Ceratobasidium sp. AG-Ba]QRW11759.1 Transposase family Tnp2 protein [Ceratobasidium sp. AG-Ba]